MHTINLGVVFVLIFSWTVDINVLKLELFLNFTVCLYIMEWD